MSNLDTTTVARLEQPLAALPQQRYVPGVLIVGKYRLEARLGEGGMGTVWLARNVTLDAHVALKLIHPSIQAEETVERLLVEARVQAKLKHPNIVRVFDFGQTEFGDAFIVMEVLEGVTLGTLIQQRGGLNAAEAVQIMLPVIGALCHAHDNGVVHRDLKPENIFLDRGAVDVGPKLLDFGIAKLTHEDPNRHSTKGGTLLGSPAYMAPEQAQGLEDVDHRADIWAICVVLYEAVSGKQAFPGEGYTVLRRVVEEPLAPLEDRGADEGGLFQVLARGLEKDRTCRFQSMRELGTALAQWLYDQGESEDLYGNRISRSWKVVKAPSKQWEPLLLDVSAEPGCSRSRRDVQLIELPVEYLAGGMAAANGVAAATGSTGRLAVVPRLALVAGIVLAGISMPSKLRVEAASSQHHAISKVALAPNKVALAPEKPATNSARLAVADVSEAPILLTRSIAMPQAEVSEKRDEPRRSPRRLSETELGLKVPY